MDANVIRIGMCIDNKPYIVPLNFGYDGKSFFIHCAKQGKKIDILKQNPNVWFEITSKQDIIESQYDCDWTCDYTSVMGSGKAVFLESDEQKRYALSVIMNKFAPDKTYGFPDKSVANVCIIKIDIEDITGKSTVAI